MTQEETVFQGLQYENTLEVKETPGKGRGVFATDDIGQGDFICEYRTKRVYHPSKKARYEREYETNGEGSLRLYRAGN